MLGKTSCRNITMGRHRTSVRMATFYWDALDDICKREEVSWQEICSHINDRRCDSTLTDAIRLFIMSYFRCAALSSERSSERRADGVFAGTPFECDGDLLHRRNATTHDAEDEADEKLEASEPSPMRALAIVVASSGIDPASLQAAE